MLRRLSPDRSFFPFGRWPACLPWILGISCLSLNSVTSFRVYLRVDSCLLAFSVLQWTLDVDIWAFLHFLSVYLFSSSTLSPSIGSLLSVLHIYLSFDRCHLLVFLPAVWFLSHLLPFRVTDPVFHSGGPWPWCLQCGFHFCYSFIFCLFLSLALPAFFSHHVVVFGSLFHFFGSWTILSVFSWFSEIIVSRVFVFCFFIAFLLYCFPFLLLHKYHNGLFCLLFVFA